MPLNKVLGPDIPDNRLVCVVFCFFGFPGTYLVFAVLVADNNFPSQKQKNRGKPKKQLKIIAFI